MNKASLLLQTTALPVKQIAEMVGYKDALVFSKAFKQKIGSSPKAFRDSSGTLSCLIRKTRDRHSVRFVYLSIHSEY